MKKKGKKNNLSNNGQIPIAFDQNVSSQTGSNSTASTVESVKETFNTKVIGMYSKAHLYKRILNRKME